MEMVCGICNGDGIGEAGMQDTSGHCPQCSGSGTIEAEDRSGAKVQSSDLQVAKREEIKMDCSCKHSDSWRCAREQGLGTLACGCGCHSYLTDIPKPETATGNLSNAAPGSAPAAFELVQVHEGIGIAEVIIRDKNHRVVYAGNLPKVANPDCYAPPGYWDDEA